MSDSNTNEFNETITKQDWVAIVQWISTRWPVNWSDGEVVSIFEDYKLIPKKVIWDSLFLYYKSSSEFFSLPKFFQVCHETWKRLEEDAESHKQLSSGTDFYQKNAGGLIEYLELNGYDSFAHAVYDKMITRFKNGKAENHEDVSHWDLDEPWESAKAKFLEWFPTHKPLEELKNKRESNNGK